MDETSIDLRDRRGRLLRFVIAIVVGGVASVVLRPFEPSPELDFSGKYAALVVTLGLFVGVAALTSVVLARIARRLSRR